MLAETKELFLSQEERMNIPKILERGDNNRVGVKIQRWTPEQDTILLRGIENGTSFNEVVIEINQMGDSQRLRPRSPSSVHFRIGELRRKALKQQNSNVTQLNQHTRKSISNRKAVRRRAWSNKDYSYLKRACKATVSWKEIAGNLDRTEKAVKKMASAMKYLKYRSDSYANAGRSNAYTSRKAAPAPKAAAFTSIETQALALVSSLVSAGNDPMIRQDLINSKGALDLLKRALNQDSIENILS